MIEVLAFGAFALQAQPAVNPLFAATLACRQVTGEAERARCYDAAVGQMSAAHEAGTLLITDRRRAQRSVFGLGLGNIFGGDGEDTPRELESAVVSAAGHGYNRWRVVLEEGGTWETTDPVTDRRLPRPGERVKLIRSGLAYWLSVPGQGRVARAMRIR